MSELAETVEVAVRDALRHILARKGRAASLLSRERHLTTDLGLQSLDLAELVALLEVSLRADPFSRLVSVTDVRTVGDLCAAYEQCLASNDGPSPGSGATLPSAKRVGSAAADLRRRARDPEL